MNSSGETYVDAILAYTFLKALTFLFVRTLDTSATPSSDTEHSYFLVLYSIRYIFVVSLSRSGGVHDRINIYPHRNKTEWTDGFSCLLQNTLTIPHVKVHILFTCMHDVLEFMCRTCLNGNERVVSKSFEVGHTRSTRIDSQRCHVQSVRGTRICSGCTINPPSTSHVY